MKNDDIWSSNLKSRMKDASARKRHLKRLADKNKSNHPDQAKNPHKKAKAKPKDNS